MNEPQLRGMADMAFALALAWCAVQSARVLPAASLQAAETVAQALACGTRGPDDAYLERLGTVLSQLDGFALPLDCIEDEETGA